MRSEVSLGNFETIQARLAQNERDLQKEIALLEVDLKKEQDSSRMQVIQEMISVCMRLAICYGPSLTI